MQKRNLLSMLLFLCVVFTLSNTGAAQRRITEEAIIFQKLRDGVFTVFGDEGHGSGFLIDRRGMILTNHHVISNSSYIRIQIDDTTKVAGKLLVVDELADIAILLVHSSVVRDLPVLRIPERRDELAFAGERVIAIGSPLHQSKILTSGIISKVEETAIISDVNLNPGNSGGPLINMDEEVIAINTFLDPSRTIGPGLSGSVSITDAYSLIEIASNMVEIESPPEPTLLPVMPTDAYPLHALKHAASVPKRDTKSYEVSKLTPAGKYNIRIMSPPYIYRAEKSYELELSKKRKQREEKGKAGKEETYNPYEDLKSWTQYVGKYAPTVIVEIIPQMGETSGSQLLNILGAVAGGLSGTSYYGSHKYEFKADLKDLKIWVDNTLKPEIERAMVFVPLDFSRADYFATHSGSDLARAGIFVFSYELFAPNEHGWPRITMEISSIDKPDDPLYVTIPRRTVETVWLDFEPYREQLAAEKTELSVGQ